MFGIGGCEELKSSIVWVQRHEKCEHQMKRCVADQKVSDWQMTPCVTVLLWMATVAQLNPPIMCIIGLPTTWRDIATARPFNGQMSDVLEVNASIIQGCMSSMQRTCILLRRVIA